MIHVARCTPVAVAVLSLSLLAACGKEEAAPPAPPPPTVSVITVSPAAVPVTDELPGRVEAFRVAQVRARTPGIVLKREFEEGSDVKAGQVLFRIDPAEFRAGFASAEAAVQKAEANLAQANLR